MKYTKLIVFKEYKECFLSACSDLKEYCKIAGEEDNGDHYIFVIEYKHESYLFFLGMQTANFLFKNN